MTIPLVICGKTSNTETPQKQNDDIIIVFFRPILSTINNPIIKNGIGANILTNICQYLSDFFELVLLKNLSLTNAKPYPIKTHNEKLIQKKTSKKI